MRQVLKGINPTIFAVLFAGGLLGVIAVLPYVLALSVHLPIDPDEAPRIPLPLLVILTLVQNGLLLAVVIVIGMRLSERIGLEMPLIRAWATGTAAPELRTIVPPGMLLGAAVGAALVGLEALCGIFQPPCFRCSRSRSGSDCWPVSSMAASPKNC